MISGETDEHRYAVFCRGGSLYGERYCSGSKPRCQAPTVWRFHEPIEAAFFDVSQPVLGKDEMVTGVDISTVFPDVSTVAGLGKDTQLGTGLEGRSTLHCDKMPSYEQLTGNHCHNDRKSQALKGSQC